MVTRDDGPVPDRPARLPGCRPGSAGIKISENPGITAEEELPFFSQRDKNSGKSREYRRRGAPVFFPQRDKIPEIPGLPLKRSSRFFIRREIKFRKFRDCR
jgi:hypothetical protein